MDTLKFELDLEQTREFQRLFVMLNGAKAQALFVVWSLYRDLGYLAKSHGRLGFLPKNDVDLLMSSIGVKDEAAVLVLLQLIDSGWLKEEEDGYLCLRFMNSNAHLTFGGSERDKRALGGMMKGFKAQMRRNEETVTAQALLIPEHLFVTRENEPMDADAIRRVTLIIKGVDAALGLAERKKWEFKQPLIQSAHEVLQQMTDEEINVALQMIVRNRGHRALPHTTEQVLPILRELPGKLA